MNSISAEQLIRFFEFNRWANIELIKVCATLTDEQLQTAIAGMPGAFRPIIRHLVFAEGRYISRLGGVAPWDVEPDWDTIAIGEYVPLAEATGSELLRIVKLADPAVRHDAMINNKPYHHFNWTVMLQAIYHGIEHRTHLKLLLTACGVPHPELAVWNYSAVVAGIE